MKIVQILLKDTMVLGLSDSNHVYKWNQSGGKWDEYWHSDRPNPEVTHRFRQAGGNARGLDEGL